jgi:hypothetical protein
MNFSGSGVSWTLGPRGASIGIGKRGTFLNTGIPGTGLYSRERLGKGSTTRQSYSGTGTTQTIEITISITDDGVLSFKDAQGNPVPEALIDVARRQQGEKIKTLIQEKCDELTAQVEALGKIHLYTPDPHIPPQFIPLQFSVPKPSEPISKSPGFFGRLFKSYVARIEEENKNALEDHAKQVEQWEKQKADFDATQLERRQFIERVISGDTQALEQSIEEILNDIVWPRETLVGLDIRENGSTVLFDVDLPEIEEMPTRIAGVQSGYPLYVKEMGAAQVQELYMKHVHAVGFRIIGEAFATSPAVRQVILSAYSQRPNKATGHISDEYLYSVRVNRDDWTKINFCNLEQLDIVEVLAQFELRRGMTKTGVFKAIEPIAI